MIIQTGKKISCFLWCIFAANLLLMTLHSVFFSNTLSLLRSTLIQLGHCCIRETLRAMPDPAGRANGSKPESLRSVGVSFFNVIFPPCSENHRKCILGSQEYRKGSKYLSQQAECWKGTIWKGQRIKSHESIFLWAFCCCSFESTCSADVFPMWLGGLFPSITSAIDALHLLYT